MSSEDDLLTYVNNRHRHDRYFLTEPPKMAVANQTYRTGVGTSSSNQNACLTKFSDREIGHKSPSSCVKIRSTVSLAATQLQPTRDLTIEMAGAKQKLVMEQRKDARLFSSASWLPGRLRLAQLQREAKELDHATSQIAAVHAFRDKTGGQPITQFELETNEFNLGTLRKLACGCCGVEYLPVNLPFSVTRKAIADMRHSWEVMATEKCGADKLIDRFEPHESGHGSLTSESHWQELSRDLDAESIDSYVVGPETCMKEYRSGSDMCTDYSAAPLCRFCAQLFADPGQYRPSTAQQKEKRRVESKRRAEERQRLRWDPLRRLEQYGYVAVNKDRQSVVECGHDNLDGL